ncbi:serine/threonine protein kinase [Roseiconus nitratireducens]|uniref:Serine/threonine protein kinase n=1 Tax=Roseiconus nitratireducens TaxID=2605748 RepID=A0A5M6D9N8_9BACT|nr:serine/threonine-protein kinase [Roseiconus nitratireducens]KAA5542659.1 serine/threonine protein kinase [Roseiconus nitratireducens]
MNLRLVKVDDPAIDESMPVADSIEQASPAEIRLQELLEQYTNLIEGGEPFARSEWLRQVEDASPGLIDEVRESIVQIDALARLACYEQESDSPFPNITGFRCVGKLGQGGNGIVYEAIEEKLGRRVALKVFPGVIASDTKAHARFIIEAQAAARLNHPRIVPVYQIGEGDSWGAFRYMAMQLVNGQSLAKRLEQGVPEPMRAVAWMIDVAEAIAHAHQCGVIHRDIKPSNLLIDEAQNVMVTDFGLARLRFRADATDCRETLTATGDRVGTLAYMSPQQAAGDPVDERTDVYSLGLTLYEMLTGRRAIEGATIDEVDSFRKRTTQLSLRQFDKRLPRELGKIVAKATMADVVDRYPSVSDFLDDLRRFRDGRPVTATSPSVARRISLLLVRHRTLAITLAGTCLLATGIAWLVAARLAIAHHQLQDALNQSQQNLHRSEEILDRFGLLAADQLRHVEGAQNVRRELLSTALTYYQEHAECVGSQSGFSQQSGITHFKAAQILDEMGADQDAVHAYLESMQLLKNLRRRSPLAERTLGLCLNNLAVLDAEADRRERAHWMFHAAIEQQRRWHERSLDPQPIAEDLARTRGNFAMLMIREEQFGQATEQLERSLDDLEAAEESREVELVRSMVLSNLAFLARDDSPRRAESLLNEAINRLTNLERRTRQDGGELQRVEVIQMLANAHSDMATLQVHRPGDALANYRQAEHWLESISEIEPFDRQFAAQWAVTLNDHGRLLVSIGQTDQGAKRFVKAISLLESLARVDSTAEHYRWSLAGTLLNLGRALGSSGRYAEAKDALQRSLLIQRSDSQSVSESNPSIRQSRAELLGATTAELARLDAQRQGERP